MCILKALNPKCGCNPTITPRARKNRSSDAVYLGNDGQRFDEWQMMVQASK
ncbi:hypothetical protein [Avibacterium paragallinarum]|uniref:hypothetical protein n=1 Tax=Avibacterium paragallinarum TaxID=728 RepID=UPI002161B612|nr:hypothetical protein [Avibacterium paragallinarum]